MTTIHDLDTVRYMIPSAYTPEVVKAPPMAVAKALTLIVLTVAFICGGVMAGVVLLSFPPPAPSVVVQPTTLQAQP